MAEYAELVYSDNQAITGDAKSTNILEGPGPDSAIFGYARGGKPLYFRLDINESFVNSDSSNQVEITLEQADTKTGTYARVQGFSFKLPLSELKAEKVFYEMLPVGLTKKYHRVDYNNSSSTNNSAGKVSTRITSGVTDNTVGVPPKTVQF